MCNTNTEDLNVVKGDNLLFSPGTRLMCPNCLTVSNSHNVLDFLFYIYTTPAFETKSYFACYHECKSCGATDAPFWENKEPSQCNICFIDSGNYESSDYIPGNISKWTKELEQALEEVRLLKSQIKRAQDDFNKYWGTSEDVN